MISTPYFAILLSIFGLVIVFRTFKTPSLHCKLHRDVKFLTILIFICGNFHFQEDIQLLALFDLAVVFMPFCLVSVKKNVKRLKNKQKIDETICFIIEDLVSLVRSNISVRAALEKLHFARVATGPCEVLTSIHQGVFGTKLASEDIFTRSKRENEAVEVLILASERGHRASEILQSYRMRLKKEILAKKKYHQAIGQARSQSVVISVLYILIMIFMHWQFDLTYYRGVVLTSLSLFMIGNYFLWKGSSGVKWKL